MSSRCLRARKRATVLFVRRVARKVVAAETLDGDDRSPLQRFNHVLEWLREPRSADGASDRLGVEAAVTRVLVFVPAICAEWELSHRGQRPVVRNADDDREPRSALGAVDERVAKPSVVGIEQLAEAVVAGRNVRRDRRRPTLRRACLDHELGVPTRGGGPGENGVHTRERRRLVPQSGEEPIELGDLPFRFDDHSLTVVEYKAAERMPTREPVDERPETHALDDTGDPKPPSLALRHRPIVAFLTLWGPRGKNRLLIPFGPREFRAGLGGHSCERNDGRKIV